MSSPLQGKKVVLLSTDYKTTTAITAANLDSIEAVPGELRKDIQMEVREDEEEPPIPTEEELVYYSSLPRRNL
jgi:hypothetical protein